MQKPVQNKDGGHPTRESSKEARASIKLVALLVKALSCTSSQVMRFANYDRVTILGKQSRTAQT